MSKDAFVVLKTAHLSPKTTKSIENPPIFDAFIY